MWTDPGTGRVLLPPPVGPSVVAREHYRSKVGLPPSRAETARAEKVARLRALRDEVHAPDRRQLRAMAAEVRAPDVLGRLRAARDRLDRVDAWLALWRRRAGRKAPLPTSLSRANDAAFNEFTAAWVEASAMVAAVQAVTPGPSRDELAAMRRQVHVATSVRGWSSSRSLSGGARVAAGSVGRGSSPTVAGSSSAQAAARARFAREEHRRIANRFYDAARLVAETRGTAGHGAALVAAANLRAEAEALHPVLLGVGR